MHMHFLPGLCFGSRWESLQHSQDPLARLRGLLLKERNQEGVEEERNDLVLAVKFTKLSSDLGHCKINSQQC